MKKLVFCSVPASLLLLTMFSFQNCTGTQLELPEESTEASSIEVPIPAPVEEEESDPISPDLILVSEEVIILQNAILDLSVSNQLESVDFMHIEGTVKSIKIKFFDPDYLQEGLMLINGANPIVLFEGTGLSAAELGVFDKQQVDINFNLLPEQSNSIVVGVNKIDFQYTASAGYSIYSITLIVEKLVPVP